MRVAGNGRSRPSPAAEFVPQLHRHERIESEIHQPRIARRRPILIETQHLHDLLANERAQQFQTFGWHGRDDPMPRIVVGARSLGIGRASFRRRLGHVSVAGTSVPGTRAARTCKPR